MNTAGLNGPAVSSQSPPSPADRELDTQEQDEPADRPEPEDGFDPEGPDPGQAGHGWQRAVALTAVPLAIFVVTRAAQCALIAWMLPPGTSSVRDRLLSWDTGWFVRVAREGYPSGYTYGDSGEITGNGLAFFPGFPLLVRGVHALGGGSFETAALIAGTVAGCLATLAVYALGVNLYDHRVGVALATLFCAQPMSVVLSMGYSEGVFVAFAAGSLVAVRRNAWLAGGILGLGAALTRPTGAAVGLAIAFAAGMRLVSTGWSRANWRPMVGAVLALSGVPGYLLWVGLRAGSLTAWFDIQTAGWGTTFDAGATVYRFIEETLRGNDGWLAVSVAWILIAVVLLAFCAVTQRVWAPLLVYGLISLVLVIGQAGFYHSKPRLLVPVLIVLVPPALAIGRARLRAAIPALVGYAVFGLWYGSYLLTVWHYAI